MPPNPETGSNSNPEAIKPYSIIDEANSFKTPRAEQARLYRTLIDHFIRPDLDPLPPNVDQEMKMLYLMESVATIAGRNPEVIQKRAEELNISDEDLQKAIKLGVARDLFSRIGSSSFHQTLEGYKQSLGVPPEFFQDPNAKKSAVEAFYRAETNPNNNKVGGYTELFHLTPEESKPIIEKYIPLQLVVNYRMASASLNQVVWVLRNLGIADSDSSLEQSVNHIYRQAIDTALTDPNLDNNLAIKNERINIAIDFLGQAPQLLAKEPNLISEIRQRALSLIKKGNIELLSQEINSQFLDRTTPEYYQAVRFGLFNYLNDEKNDGTAIFAKQSFRDKELTKEILSNPRFKPLIFNKFKNALQTRLGNAPSFTRVADISDYISSSDGQELLKSSILAYEGRVDFGLRDLISLIHGPDEFTASPGFQKKIIITLFELKGASTITGGEDYIPSELGRMMTPETTRCLSLNEELFGEFATKDTFNAIQGLFYGQLAPELQTLGITKAGKEGIEQLKSYINSWLPTIFNPDIDQVLANPLLTAIFKSSVRFDTSEWGGHGDDEFKVLLRNYQFNLSIGNIPQLPPEYKPSGIIEIDNIDKAKRAEFTYSQGFLTRFGTLKQSINGALGLLNHEKPLENLGKQVIQIRTQVIERLQQEATRLAANPKAAENIQQQINKLNQINIFSYRSLQQNFATLGRFPEFAEVLRQGIFMASLRRHPEQQLRVSQLLSDESPTYEDITGMINFVDHITNKETFNEYFTDKNAKRKFSEITDVKSLEDELGRIKNIGSGDTTSFQFIPTKGLMMELSGHVGDACWASKYHSIAAEFPNMTSVIMVRNPEDPKKARLAGAAMLIEANEADGTPVLIIRGLNPQESVINSLVVSDFYRKFTNYCFNIALERRRQLVIVIDNHSGGAATNRPALHRYMQLYHQIGAPYTLASANDTTFNGYNIVNSTYSA